MILLAIIFTQNFTKAQHNIDKQIQNQMRICSYNLKCKGLKLDFVPKIKSQKTHILYKDKNLYSFFEIPTENNYLLKVILAESDYKKILANLRNNMIGQFIVYAFIIALLSLLFSLYALKPIKNALTLNEEFIRDILHDINTPLSSLLVNFKLLQKEFGENHKISRMYSNISTILSIQKNLHDFLNNSQLQKEQFELQPLLQERIAHFQVLYPHIKFSINDENHKLETSKDAFIRIVDNLFSNACKYSHHNGIVTINVQKTKLIIQDNGRGIQNPKRVFERFYKENDRGVGIGMHIVKKLCDTLLIRIDLDSEVTKGTTVKLDLNEVIVK